MQEIKFRLMAAVAEVRSRDRSGTLCRGEQWGNRFLEALECLRVLLKNIKQIAAAAGCCQRLQGEIKDATFQLAGENPATAEPGWERQRAKERATSLPVLDLACNKTALDGDVI